MNDPLPQSPRVRHWEDAGIVVGVVLLLVNVVAVLTDWLAGPLFHPAWIIFGFVLAYAGAAMRAGALSDPFDTS